ncbi:MAG: hypothetical protein ACTHXO_10745 [Actinomycetaceae bacterium]
MTGYGSGYGPPQGGSQGGYEDAYARAQGGGYGGGGYGPGPQGAHNPYGQGGDGIMPARTPRSTKGPKTLTFIGLAVLVVGVIAIIVAAVAVGRFIQDADIRTVGPSGTQIEAEAGEEWALYASDTGAAQSQTQTCRVVGPDGADVRLTAPGTDVTVNDYARGHTFTTDQAGTYTVTCDRTAYVGSNLSGGDVVAAAGGIILGAIGAIVGFVLMIIGVIWWIARRN